MTSTQPPATAGQPRRRRRVFMWVFLAIQAVFVAWIVTGLTASPPACHGLDASGCASASDVGHGVALAAQVAAWVTVDFILGVTWAVVRFSRRSR